MKCRKVSACYWILLIVFSLILGTQTYVTKLHNRKCTISGTDKNNYS